MNWIKKHKSLWLNIGLFLLIFIIAFVLSYMIVPVWCDQIWSYGFSYNISKGMVIYKDFNVVQTPFYFMIASFFISIFGNYMISTCIFDSLLIACLGVLLFKMIGWKGIFPLIVVFIVVPSPYNLLCLVFLFFILYLIHKDMYNDFLVAFLVGLVFITKQNIGVLLFVPMFFYSKHKIKSVLIFLIPFLLLCVYLLCNGAFFSFVDYAFLGLFAFSGNKNIVVSILVEEILCVSYLIYLFVKERGHNKELSYVLAFQFVLFPLCDLNHFVFPFVSFLYYFLKHCQKRIIKMVVCILVFLYFGSTFFFNFYPFDVQTKKDLLYLRSPSALSRYLKNIYQEYDGEIENVYFDSEYSYLLKLYYDVPIREFDFLLDGNLGYYSRERIFQDLEKHCEEEKCIFMIYKNESSDSQFSEYRNYIKKHYQKIGNYEDMDIYSSK